MFTRDIEIDRIKAEYESLRQAQDGMMSGMNILALVLFRLEEAVQENRKAIDANREAIDEIRLGLRAMLEHFEIPTKPGTGFNPEKQE